MTAIIQTRNLTKTYGGSLAVNNVSFSVEKGEVIGFVGLNGAGKSTTINMLLGFQYPSKGEVELFGEKVTLPNAHISHRRIGFATGDMSLFDGMTGSQYLRFVARSYGTSTKTEVFKSLVDRFDPQLNKKLSALSRGNKQKIALISAFMTSPELVILDEPSSGLDPLMQQHFIELVRDASEKGTTVFMSSHYLNEVIDVCSRILLIKNGDLVKDIPTSELEMGAGKLVRVVTKQKVSPPKSAEMVEQDKHSEGYVLQFIFKDKSLRLQEWIGTLPHLQDLSITDHSAQAAFEDLYTDEPEPSNV
ncbi:MAG: ABC transporter ATP-binding protein [Candidatus Saccharimonadaceae bacterium]